MLPFFVGQTTSKRTTTKEGLLISKEPRVNEKIRAREVRLVDPDGGQIGIKGIDEARWLADQSLCRDFSSAAAPATWGEAMDVPDMAMRWPSGTVLSTWKPLAKTTTLLLPLLAT